MNTIDINEGFARNLEWQARKQAELDDIYDKARNKHTSYSYNNDNPNDVSVRLSAIENTLSRIETKINSIYDFVINPNECDKLFVFAPSQNVKANVAFNLSEEQFKELIRQINR